MPMHRCRGETAPAYEVPPLPLRAARDELPFQRPMGGIVYSIQAAATELCFVTSCDVPILNSTSIRLRPLRAVYHRLVLP